MKKTIASVVAAGVLVTGGFIVTRHEEPTIESSQENPRPTAPVAVPPVPPPTPLPGFRTITIQTSKPAAEIINEVGSENLNLVLAFNRLDVAHIQKGVVITMPKNLEDWNALSPFPRTLPVGDDIAKLILVSQRIQAFAAYENGALVRWGAVSTGKSTTQTPSRLYYTNWKGKHVISNLEGAYVLPWAFNLESKEGISMHQFDLPGYPASHACVRLLEQDAMWLYDWANQWILDDTGQNELAKGTPVIIFGQYAYGKTAPWKKLATDPDATTITPDELREVIEPNLDTIYTDAQKRSEIESKN